MDYLLVLALLLEKKDGTCFADKKSLFPPLSPLLYPAKVNAVVTPLPRLAKLRTSLQPMADASHLRDGFRTSWYDLQTRKRLIVNNASRQTILQPPQNRSAVGPSHQQWFASLVNITSRPHRRDIEA